ncbi:LOW QUALITY PROTEIN: mitochondrial enolase superfamily member 1 [Phoenicopterus ruber ruber]
MVNRDIGEIVNNFGGFYRELTSNRQLCWIGPEKGTVHVAIAAVLNALRVKREGKDAKQLPFCMDFGYTTDVLTDEEAYGSPPKILQNGLLGKKEREEQIEHGYLACTRSCAWLGYSEQLNQSRMKLTHKGREVIRKFFLFKVKLGADLQDDICRCRFIQEMIGPDKIMMLDANQQWEIKEAIEWVTTAEFKPPWIKEPTFPDEDMHVQMGHATIPKALAPLGIGVVIRERCHNRVIVKQLLQAKALSYLQIDSCRLGSVDENLSVLLMAKKFQGKALQNAAAMRRSFRTLQHGLGGLCELVQRLVRFDYIPVSESLESRLVIQITPVAIDYGDHSFSP